MAEDGAESSGWSEVNRDKLFESVMDWEPASLTWREVAHQGKVVSLDWEPIRQAFAKRPLLSYDALAKAMSNELEHVIMPKKAHGGAKKRWPGGMGVSRETLAQALGLRGKRAKYKPSLHRRNSLGPLAQAALAVRVLEDDETARAELWRAVIGETEKGLPTVQVPGREVDKTEDVIIARKRGVCWAVHLFRGEGEAGLDPVPLFPFDFVRRPGACWDVLVMDPYCDECVHIEQAFGRASLMGPTRTNCALTIARFKAAWNRREDLPGGWPKGLNVYVHSHVLSMRMTCALDEHEKADDTVLKSYGLDHADGPFSGLRFRGALRQAGQDYADRAKRLMCSREMVHFSNWAPDERQRQTDDERRRGWAPPSEHFARMMAREEAWLEAQLTSGSGSSGAG